MPDSTGLFSYPGDPHGDPLYAASIVAGMLYRDTTSASGTLKLRNDANTAWITIASGGGGGSSGIPALTLGTTNGQGVATTFVATDATIALFDATVPTTIAYSATAAAGAASAAARRDHTHGMVAAPNATLTTALTVDTGTVTLHGNAANTSVVTIGAGAVGIAGSNTGDQTNIAGNAATATTASTVTGLTVTTGKTLTVNNSLTVAAGADSQTMTFPAVSDTVAGLATAQKLTHTRVQKRVNSVGTGASVTPATDLYDVTYQLNTEVGGTLTINAPTGTPDPCQPHLIKIKCTNQQTLSWNGAFVAGLTALPVTTTGGGKIDYFAFLYDDVNTGWDFTGSAMGF